MSAYNDPILQKVIDIIKASNQTIKTYYQGDPIIIGKSDLPACLVIKDKTEIGDETNAQDYHRIGVNITVISDIRTDFGDVTKRVVLGDARNYDLLEGRNDDFTLKDDSLINILRISANLGNNCNIDMETPMTTDYGFTIGQRGEKSWSWEGYLSFNLYYTQLRGDNA